MRFVLAVLTLALAVPVFAQDGPVVQEFYASWGYNADWYAPTDIRFVQPERGTNLLLYGVRGHDDKGWTTIWRHDITIPQYSIRIGAFFNSPWGVEINYEHTKFIVTQDQVVRASGTINGQPAPATMRLTDDVLRYKLNNGANFLLFNLVRRLPLVGAPGADTSVVGLVKVGVGFMIPHTENTLFGEPNVPGFQITGPDAGIEAAVRVNVARGFYTELSFKGVWAHYRDINIADGAARQDLRSSVATFSIGYRLRRY